MDENTSSDKFERSDIIIIGTYKYVIHNITKKHIQLLPIDLLLESDESVYLIPKITIDRNLLFSYTKADNNELLYLLNQKNPLIVETLEYFLSNEKK